MYSKEFIKKIQRITKERFETEVLMRILIKCMEDENDLKPYDQEVLSQIIYKKLIFLKEDINWLNLELKI